MSTWQGDVKWIIPFFAHASKKANKTAQWANLVVQSETENTHKGPKLGIKPRTFWTSILPGLCCLPSLPSILPHTPTRSLGPRGVCMCAHACLSPQRYCTLLCRATLYSLDVLCLYSHWSLWMETPLLNLFSELVYLFSSRSLSLYLSLLAFKWQTVYHLHTPICRSFAPPLCFYPTGMNKECIDYIPGLRRSKTGDCMDLLSRQLTHFSHALLTDILENG